MITVSEPQRLSFSDYYVPGFVSWLRNKGVDVHEFATAYVERTSQLGYAPDLKVSAEEFVKERC